MNKRPCSADKRLARTVMQIAKGGGALLRKYHAMRTRKQFTVEYKGTSIDLVTDVDRKVEKLIKEAIEAAYPDHGIISEEGSAKKPDSGTIWYVDPLDGTTNFVHGYPHFAVSIGVERDGQVVMGCVYDPIRDELFFAHKGCGARLNNKKIRVSRSTQLDRSLLVTGFPYDVRSSPQNNLDYWNKFAVKARAIRRDGSAALDLCYVAAGRFDGFWELKLKPWDMAAGQLIVTEAGGTVSDFLGNPVGLFTRELLADNGLIHKEMMVVLRECMPQPPQTRPGFYKEAQ